MERLIHADSNRAEVGMITDFISFDAQIHHNCELTDNTFQIVLSVGAWQAEKIMRGDYIYIDGSEFGGLVRSVITPPAGQAYKVYENEELNTMIADVIGNDYVNLFQVSSEDTGATTSYQFRYQTKLAGLSKALLQVGYTLSCEYDASIQRVKVKARHCIDYSDYADISSDLGIGLSITVGRVDDYNHCIALGTGELTERMVRELWLYNGTIYTEKPAALLEGDIRSMTFDYPNAESEDELLSSARDALLEHAPLTTAEIDLSQIQLDLQLDDTILTVDRDLNISATKSVSQRVLTISTRGETIRTEVE